MGFHFVVLNHRRLGHHRPNVSFLGHLAIGYQHRHNHCYVLNGFPDPDTQNRDAKAIHLKLDELLKGVKGARTGLVNLEQLSDAS